MYLLLAKHTRTWSGKNRHIEIYPTSATFRMLERWEAVHDKYPSKIPYDVEAVKNQDWEKLYDDFSQIDKETYEDLHEYIVNSDIQSKAVENINKELKVY